jgi:type I restriction enzyme M protein
MFEQTFKNIDDILQRDAGCGSELDYVGKPLGFCFWST